MNAQYLGAFQIPKHSVSSSKMVRTRVGVVLSQSVNSIGDIRTRADGQEKQLDHESLKLRSMS